MTKMRLYFNFILITVYISGLAVLSLIGIKSWKSMEELTPRTHRNLITHVAIYPSLILYAENKSIHL